jgi:hypothetical protein
MNRVPAFVKENGQKQTDPFITDSETQSVICVMAPGLQIADLASSMRASTTVTARVVVTLAGPVLHATFSLVIVAIQSVKNARHHTSASVESRMRFF